MIIFFFILKYNIINFTKFELSVSRVILVVITRRSNLEYLQVWVILIIKLLLFAYFLILNALWCYKKLIIILIEYKLVIKKYMQKKYFIKNSTQWESQLDA